jgi:hypothetical protein
VSDGEDYGSGPYCEHWAISYECEDRCARCGHECRRHYEGDGRRCVEAGCACAAWVEPPKPARR